MKGNEVETDRNDCMSCGRKLSDPVSAMFGSLGDQFGFGPTKLPNQVKLLMERVDSALTIIVNGEGPTKRATLRALRDDVRQSLKEYG